MQLFTYALYNNCSVSILTGKHLQRRPFHSNSEQNVLHGRRFLKTFANLIKIGF